MSLLAFPLHFLRPWWWLALVPLPLVLWLLARSAGGRVALARLADAALLPYLVHVADTRRRLALGLAALAWLLAVTALAGPAWQKLATPLYVNGAARVVALSLSDDMLAQDLPPDRMTRARFAVRDLLDSAGDARTALVAYAGAAFTVAPLTSDRHTVLNLLRALRPDVMPVPGNDAAAGIRKSTDLLRHAHAKGGEIVLVTDTADAAAVAAARAARAQGIRVDVLGIGTTQGAPVPQAGGGFGHGAHGLLLARRDDAALRAVAQAGGGRYVILRAGGVGADAFAAPVAEGAHASRRDRAQLWQDGGIWLLPALLVLAALAFRRGWLLVWLVLVLPLGMPAAHAASRASWFANRDQRALSALQHGDAAQARRLATSPGLRGAAAYRAGDFADAAQAFAQGDGARARYNLGNALAKQGEYRQAMAAYRQALQRDPGFTDARANLDAVEAWLRQHPPPQGRQGSASQAGAGSPSASRAKASAGARPGQSPGQSGKSPGSTASARSRATSGGSAASTGTAQAQQGRAGAAAQPDAADGASPGDVARQRQQQRQAAQGLARELQQGRQPAHAGARAFALGQAATSPDGRFNAQQRALLQSVPDDPGALLRRKFRLEWAQRHGGQDEDGQP